LWVGLQGYMLIETHPQAVQAMDKSDPNHPAILPAVHPALHHPRPTILAVMLAQQGRTLAETLGITWLH